MEKVDCGKSFLWNEELNEGGENAGKTSTAAVWDPAAVMQAVLRGAFPQFSTEAGSACWDLDQLHPAAAFHTAIERQLQHQQLRRRCAAAAGCRHAVLASSLGFALGVKTGCH